MINDMGHSLVYSAGASVLRGRSSRSSDVLRRDLDLAERYVRRRY